MTQREQIAKAKILDGFNLIEQGLKVVIHTIDNGEELLNLIQTIQSEFKKIGAENE